MPQFSTPSQNQAARKAACLHVLAAWDRAQHVYGIGSEAAAHAAAAAGQRSAAAAAQALAPSLPDGNHGENVSTGRKP